LIIIHDALDHVVLTVRGDDALADAVADLHLRHVADIDRLSAGRRDHGPRQVVEALIEADAAHHQRLVAARQQPATDVRAVCGHRLRGLVERHSVALERIGVDARLVLLDQAAEADHVGDAGNDAQRRLDHPVLHRAHFMQRHVLRRLEDVAVDLSHGSGERCERGLRSGRQAHVAELFEHLLAGEVVVRAFAEGERHHRQAGDRHRAQVGLTGDAAHFPLDRERHRALYFLRRDPRQLRDDLHLHVLHVRKRLDRQVVERAQAEGDERAGQHQHEHALGEGEGDEPLEHAARRVRCRRPVPS